MNVGHSELFCFGQELVRGEVGVSLKRQGEENW